MNLITITPVMLVLVVCLVLAIGIALWMYMQKKRTQTLRSKFGPADTLVQNVMQRRGYPVGDFDQNATDLSVDHPLMVENYRIAHEIALREGQHEGTTEDLRKAMISYRALFEDLLDQTAGKP
jgi:hypothetical protein